MSEVDVDHGGLEAPVPVQLWSPASLSPDAPAPLLVAPDGSGLAQTGSLLTSASARAVVNPIRVALLDPAPGCRDSWYSANPDYLDHLTDMMLPALRGRVNVSAVAGLGVSLGAVAMMTLQRRHPNAVDALAFQSGSFFTPVLDPQESGFGYFDRICAATVEVYADPPERRVPLLLTCGAIEENLSNNQLMAEKLVRGGPSDHVRRRARCAHHHRLARRLGTASRPPHRGGDLTPTGGPDRGRARFRYDHIRRLRHPPDRPAAGHRERLARPSRRSPASSDPSGTTARPTVDTERITIEPFDLRPRSGTTSSSTGWPGGTTTRGSG